MTLFSPLRPSARFGLLLLTLAVTPAALAQVPGDLEEGDQFGSAVATGDFDGDGFQDLAVAIPFEDVGTLADAGAVNVLYGTASNLDDARAQLWTQDSPDVGDQAEGADEFGSALAAGDFDGDGFDDLAIGARGEDLPTAQFGVGQVHVLYGSAAGLTATGNFFLTFVPTLQLNLHIGDALAAGDFDGDGFDDLVLGTPDLTVSSRSSAGGVTVLYGSEGGIRVTGRQLWTQDTVGILDVAEGFDEFGQALAVGDFDNDGFDDLAVGVDESIGTIVSAGVVNVLYGSAGIGLTATGNQLWHQDVTGIEGGAESLDDFGFAVAAGDFDSDGFDDLAAGVPGEDIGDQGSAGAVNVIYGSTGVGLTATGNQVWHQDVTDILSAALTNERFGSTLTTGDFDSDGEADLAIGVPEENQSGFTDAGCVNVIYGSFGVGLTATGNQFWSQDTFDILDAPETDDEFGRSLAAGDFDNDGEDDLAIGVPFESVIGAAEAGAVHAIYGTPGTGLTATGDQFWRQGGFGGSLVGDEGEGAVAASVTETPGALALLPASPNPFAGQATLRFTLPAASPTRLTVYDALGREVARLVDETREAGEHAVAFDAGTLPSGTYLVRLEAGGQVQTQRLTRLR